MLKVFPVYRKRATDKSPPTPQNISHRRPVPSGSAVGASSPFIEDRGNRSEADDAGSLDFGNERSHRSGEPVSLGDLRVAPDGAGCEDIRRIAELRTRGLFGSQHRAGALGNKAPLLFCESCTGGA